MKLTAAVLITLGSFLVATPALAGDNDKVVICHAAGQEDTTHYETIEVGYPAAYGPAGHFYENGTPQAGHEQDYLGPCNSDTTLPTTIAPTTSEPQPTTTLGGTTTTSLVTVSTVLEPSTTSSPTTSLPTSSTEPFFSPLPTTEPLLSTTEPSTTLPVVALTTPPVPKRLPETGDNTGHLALIALGLLVVGGGATLAARRR